MYEIVFAKSFRKSIKGILQSKDHNIIEERVECIIEIIRHGKTLDPKYKDHALHGVFNGYRECHVKPDVLLLYEVDQQRFLITLINIGSHTELFD